MSIVRRAVLAVLVLLLAACSGGDNHPLMWQGAPHVGVLKEQTGTGSDPVVHRVNGEAGPGGQIIPAQTTAVHGAASQFSVLPDPGFFIEEVTGCGGERVGDSTRYLTAAVTAPCTVTASFVRAVYTVTTLVRSARGGSASGDGAFEYGAEATVTAVPDDGFTFVAWTEGPVVVSTEPVYTFEVSSNHVLQASFVETRTATPVKMPPAGAVTLFEAGNAPAGVVFASTREVVVGDGTAGIWRSEDAGATWERTSEIRATFITIASGDPSLVIAGHAGGYLVSRDGGVEWTTGTIPGPLGVEMAPAQAAAVTAEDGIYAAVAAIAGPGLFRSVDGGASWTQVFDAAQAGSIAGAQLRHVDVSPADPQVIHAATGGNQDLWRSVDGADAFFSIRDGLAPEPNLFDAGVRVDPANPDHILVEGHVSLNGGADWAQIVLPPRVVERPDPLTGELFEVYLGQDVVSPRNTVWFEDGLLRVEGNRLVWSSDGGLSWVGLPEPLALLVGATGDFDTGRLFLAEDALYLQLTGGPNLVHRVSLDLVREALAEL